MCDVEGTAGDIVHVSVFNSGFSQVFRGQSWCDVKVAVLDEGIIVRGSSHFKLTIPREHDIYDLLGFSSNILPKAAHVHLPQKLAIISEDTLLGVKVLIHDEAEVAVDEGHIVPCKITPHSTSCDSQKHYTIG